MAEYETRSKLLYLDQEKHSKAAQVFGKMKLDVIVKVKMCGMVMRTIGGIAVVVWLDGGVVAVHLGT